MSHGETLYTDRRDFRWIALARDGNQCEWPMLPLPGFLSSQMEEKYPLLRDDVTACLQPILWRAITLRETSNGSREYVAKAPVPKHDGRWVGYYVNLYFEADVPEGLSIWKNEFHVTSVAWTNPNTLPFEDCHGKECIGKMV